MCFYLIKENPVPCIVFGIIAILSIAFYCFYRSFGPEYFLKVVHSNDLWLDQVEVTHILLYPIRHCKPISLASATVTTLDMHAKKCPGLYDGCHSIMSCSSRSPVTPQDNARMVLIGADIELPPEEVENPSETLTNLSNVQLMITYPDMPKFPLKLSYMSNSSQDNHLASPDDKYFGNMVDCGDDVAEWLSYLLQDTVRLIYHKLPTEPCFYPKVHGIKDLYNYITSRDKDKWIGRNTLSVVYQDEIEQLQAVRATTHTPLDWRNFQPNFVVKRLPSRSPFWYMKYMRFGRTVVKECGLIRRDESVDVNYDTGKAGSGILSDLRRIYPNNVRTTLFGTEIEILSTGVINSFVVKKDQDIELTDPLYTSPLNPPNREPLASRIEDREDYHVTAHKMSLFNFVKYFNR